MAAAEVGIVQVALKRDSGVPVDDVVNVWHFTSAATWSASVAQEMAERVRDFYIVNPTGEINNVFSQLGSTLATSGHTIKVYRLSDPTPRVVEYQLTFAGTPGASAYPAEVAVCLSYQGTPVAGLPQSRNRGRIFLGPMAAATNIVGGDQRVPSTTQVRFGKAARDLLNQNDVTATWCIYSPTRDGLDPLTYVPNPVDDGWIDDAYDIIRGRGGKTTSRQLWDSTTPA